MSSLTEVLDQAPERARANDRRESPQNHREEMGANAGEDSPKEPERMEETEPSSLKRAWTASRKRIGRWTRDSARFRILV